MSVLGIKPGSSRLHSKCSYPPSHHPALSSFFFVEHCILLLSIESSTENYHPRLISYLLQPQCFYVCFYGTHLQILREKLGLNHLVAHLEIPQSVCLSVTLLLWLGSTASHFRSMASFVVTPLLPLMLTAMHEAGGSPPLLKKNSLTNIPRVPSKPSLQPLGSHVTPSSLNSRSFSKVLPGNNLPGIASASRPLRPLLNAAVFSAARSQCQPQALMAASWLPILPDNCLSVRTPTPPM